MVDVQERNLIILFTKDKKECIHELNNLGEEIPPVHIDKSHGQWWPVFFIHVLTQHIEIWIQEWANKELAHHPEGQSHRKSIVNNQHITKTKSLLILHKPGTQSYNYQINYSCTNDPYWILNKIQLFTARITLALYAIVIIDHALKHLCWERWPICLEVTNMPCIDQSS